MLSRTSSGAASPKTSHSAFGPCGLRKEGAGGAAALEAANQLEEYFAEIDRQHPPVSPEQAEAALSEAMRQVRPGYTPVR